MSDSSRRHFLAGAGASVAAGTVALTAGTALGTEAPRKSGAAREAVVAYVKDHRSPELRLLVGEREVIVHDADLVNRILNAAGGN